MRNKNYVYIEDFVLSFVLQKRLKATRKWSFNLETNFKQMFKKDVIFFRVCLEKKRAKKRSKFKTLFNAVGLHF